MLGRHGVCNFGRVCHESRMRAMRKCTQGQLGKTVTREESAMGGCYYIVCGSCCCNCTFDGFPCKLGVSQECMVCCLDCKFCLAIGDIPLACCCCGPTCSSNCTICKVTGNAFFFRYTGAFPCDSETPIICTLLPCCTVYPKVGCCQTISGVQKKRVSPSGAPDIEVMER